MGFNSGMIIPAVLLSLPFSPELAAAEDLRPLQPMDVFELEYADDPQISPGGETVVYVRRGFDVMTDRGRSALWSIGFDGERHRPLVTEGGPSSPRWSPDGTRLAYIASGEEGRQIRLRWMDDGSTTAVTRVREAPGGLAWSPDGAWLAYSAFVPEHPAPFCELPSPPEGATWAPRPTVIRSVRYRSDGGGYTRGGNRQIFVVPAEGGTPRQVTRGSFDHGGTLAWLGDSSGLLFSANRRADADLEPTDSELWRLDLDSGELTSMTERYGPDNSPAIDPDGALAYYLGYDDQYLGFQASSLHALDLETGESAPFGKAIDRSLSSLRVTRAGVFARYDDMGDGKLARLHPDAELLAEHVGGTSLGRPYSSGSYSVNDQRRFAVTVTNPSRPAEVAVGGGDTPLRILTDLNSDLLDERELAPVIELRVPSSADGLDIQAWLALPPGYDPDERYPLLLEIHGGPFANYGPRFSTEVQLFAAAGYAVLYVNPRGSTSYGADFANEIHHAYPGLDYDDLMSCVDEVIDRGYVNPRQLYVTGGSGGGVLTAWIVGKTDRFRAAVVAKPVINWASFALTADAYPFFYRYWFPGLPWEEPEHYWKRSPLSLVGNVKTPTMLLTGEEDYRTPISESEQYYQALKLAGVKTAFVRIPEASHGIAARPSHLVAKVLHVLAWFEKHR